MAKKTVPTNPSLVEFEGHSFHNLVQVRQEGLKLCLRIEGHEDHYKAVMETLDTLKAFATARYKADKAEKDAHIAAMKAEEERLAEEAAAREVREAEAAVEEHTGMVERAKARLAALTGA